MAIENEIPENFSAIDAAKLTLDSSLTTQTVLRNIYNQSKNGQRCIRYLDLIMPFDVMQVLLTKGFILSKAVGMMGEDIMIISWS